MTILMFYLQYLSYVVGRQLSLNSQGNNVSCKQPGFNSHQRLYELVIGCNEVLAGCSLASLTRAGSGVVRIDPLHFLAGCRTRRL